MKMCMDKGSDQVLKGRSPRTWHNKVLSESVNSELKIANDTNWLSYSSISLLIIGFWVAAAELRYLTVKAVRRTLTRRVEVGEMNAEYSITELMIARYVLRNVFLLFTKLPRLVIDDPNDFESRGESVLHVLHMPTQEHTLAKNNSKEFRRTVTVNHFTAKVELVFFLQRFSRKDHVWTFFHIHLETV